MMDNIHGKNGIHRRHFLKLLGLTSLAYPLTSLSCARPNDDKKKLKNGQPNILLIVADDLGFSDLGCYGGEIKTPNLDSLAANGLRLTQFYNTGRCCPSRASILTGHYPHRVGLGHMVKDIGHPGYRGSVSENAVTIAEVLKLAGYRSFLSGKWHLGTDDPTQQGFEEFYGTIGGVGSFWKSNRYLRLPSNRKKRVYTDGQFYGTDALTDYALDFINLGRKTPDHPWFLYLAYNAPHFPLQAPKELIQKYKKVFEKGWDAIRNNRLKRMKDIGLISQKTELPPRSHWWNHGETASGQNPPWNSLSEERRTDLTYRMAIYAAMVDRMDSNIGRIIDDLKAKDELDNTLIIFISDNGACAEWDPNGFDVNSSNNNILHRGNQLEKMGGPDSYHSLGSGWANACNTPWQLYKHYNHEGGISTPCIVHWPDGLIRRGEIETSPSHIIDLMPTFAEIANVKYPEKLDRREIFPISGQSLMPVFNNRQVDFRTLYFEHEGNRAIREGSFKLTALKNNPWKLYNIDEDRTELNDLSLEYPHLVDTLAKKWELWASENNVTPFPDDYGVSYVKPPK